MAKINNRILGLVNESPDQLLANPKNYRIHPNHQRVALLNILDRVGWCSPVIVNQTTGHLLDGHLRVMIAMEKNEASIPVLYIELTEREENIILANFDPIRSLATTDPHLFSQLF